MSRDGLNSHDVTQLELQVVAVNIIAFTGIFKLYLHHLRKVLEFGKIVKPVIDVKLIIMGCAAFAALCISCGNRLQGDDIRHFI